MRKSCTKAERERWEIWCGFISKYWQIGWKSLKIYCRRKIVNDLGNCEATLLQTLSKNFVEFYCKILIFWKSFLDFNNVSYWWISWLSKLKTGDQLLIYFCNFFISRKCWSISTEAISSKYLTRSPGKTFFKRAWRVPVLQICNFNLTNCLITPQSSRGRSRFIARFWWWVFVTIIVSFPKH